MTIEIHWADHLGDWYRRRFAEVLVQGFAEGSASFSRNPEVLADTFAPLLLLERIHMARVDGEPAALAAVTVGDQECLAPDRRSVQRTLDDLHDLISSHKVPSRFLGTSEGARPGLAEFGFVSTTPRHQGKGVATACIGHLLALPYEVIACGISVTPTRSPAGYTGGEGSMSPAGGRCGSRAGRGSRCVCRCREASRGRRAECPAVTSGRASEGTSTAFRSFSPRGHRPRGARGGGKIDPGPGSPAS